MPCLDARALLAVLRGPQINRSAQSFEDKKVTKDNLCERVVEWLESPTATTQKPPSQKRGRKKSATKAASKKRAATPAVRGGPACVQPCAAVCLG